jgi:hypothetical protein
MMMINRAMTMIGLLYFWDVNRGEVENYFIWKERLEEGHVFLDLYFIETPFSRRIHDGGLNPSWYIRLGFHKRRIQTGYIGLMVMIIEV